MQPRSAAASRYSLCVAFAMSAAACRDGSSSTADASAPVASSPALLASAPPSQGGASLSPAAKPAEAARGAGCRVMTSDGGPRADADPSAWLDVAAGATFSVRVFETGRELRFEGPGRVRACGDDVVHLAAGAAVGLPGSGEGPGSEQWVATPCGVARWAGGIHRVESRTDGCKLQSSVGTAYLHVPSDVVVEDLPVDAGAPDASAASASAPHAATAGWARIDAKRALLLRLRAPADATKNALVACERAASHAQSLAERMTGDASPPAQGDGGLGELAAESVVARSAARAACAVAAVRVAATGSRAADVARLATADARWRARP